MSQGHTKYIIIKSYPCLGKIATCNKNKSRICNLGSTDEYYRLCANYSGYH